MKTTAALAIGFSIGIIYAVWVRSNTGWKKDHIVTPEIRIEVVDGKADTTYIYKMY